MPDTRTRLALLWIVVMFNMAYADILSLFIPGMHEELAQFAGDTPISQLMLIGAVIVEIPIAMIFLARVLPLRANRWANIIAAALSILFVVGGGSTTPHYLFIATIEIGCMVLIAWTAWTWAEAAAPKAA